MRFKTDQERLGLSDAETFFFKNAGYSYKPSEQTKEQGRVECAKALAKAEDEAREHGIEFVWEQDVDPDISWMDRKQRKQYRKGELLMLQAYATQDRAARGSLASLGGISVLGWSDPYRRVVNAELAQEALQSPDFKEMCRKQ